VNRGRCCANRRAASACRSTPLVSIETQSCCPQFGTCRRDGVSERTAGAQNSTDFWARGSPSSPATIPLSVVVDRMAPCIPDDTGDWHLQRGAPACQGEQSRRATRTARHRAPDRVPFQITVVGFETHPRGCPARRNCIAPQRRYRQQFPMSATQKERSGEMAKSSKPNILIIWATTIRSTAS
jgi:hypothetical protein